MPIIAESSYAASADARFVPDWKRRITVRPATMLSAWPSPIRSRPRTSMAKPPPPTTQRPPIASTSGPIHNARRKLCVRNSPSGMSATIRAKPNAPATIPSCHAASAALRAISGRTAGKAPLATRLENVVRQSRAVSDVTRPFMVNHCPMTEATIRLDVRGPVARLTFDRPHVLNAGNARFATDLGEAVSAIAARRDVRVVVMTGAGRAFQTGVDLKALVNRAVASADFAKALDEIVDKFLALPPASVTASKRLSSSAFDLDFETFRREMNTALAGCFASDEHQRAMANIRSKKRS